VICLCYVDDCLFFAKDSTDIDTVIESLRRPEPSSFDLNIEDDVAGFLGILMQKRDDGSIELLQTGLIDRVLKVMGLEDSHDKSTPSEIKALGKDENGEPCSEPWSYASVVGMLMYLASNSRPDIAYAVHSCARAHEFVFVCCCLCMYCIITRVERSHCTAYINFAIFVYTVVLQYSSTTTTMYHTVLHHQFNNIPTRMLHL
jgi:hypothetical protein